MSQQRREIGNRLREIREAHHLSQERAAEKIGVSTKHYSAVERGDSGFKIENWIKASEVLHFDLHQVLCGSSVWKISEENCVYNTTPGSEKDYLFRHIVNLIEEYGVECEKEARNKKV